MESKKEFRHAHTNLKGECKAYVCANCGSHSASSWSSRWLTPQAEEYCAVCSPGRYSSSKCPKGHPLQYVRHNKRKLICDCCKKDHSGIGKWLCNICQFNVCVKCRPTPYNDKWNVMAMNSHPHQRCQACGSWVRRHDLMLQCQECRFFVCLNCSEERTMLVRKLIRAFCFLTNMRMLTWDMTQECRYALVALIKMGLRVESLDVYNMTYYNRQKYADIIRLCPDLSDLKMRVVHRDEKEPGWKEDNSLVIALKDKMNLVSFTFSEEYPYKGFPQMMLQQALLGCPALEVIHFSGAKDCLETLAALAAQSCSLREISISSVYMKTYTGFISLAHAVSQSKSIVRLSLQSNYFDSPTAKAIFDELKDSKTLEVVDMTKNSTQFEVVWEMQDCLASHNSRTRFLFDPTYGDTRCVKFNGTEGKLLRQLLPGLARNSALELLSIMNYEFPSPISDGEIVAAFSANKSRLRSVCINSCTIPRPPAALLAKVLSALTTLEVLDISYLGIGDLGGVEIARNLRSHPSLKRGRFCGNSFRSKVGEAFMAALDENHAIQYLDVSKNNVGEKFARYPIDKHPSLLELVVGANVVVKLQKKKAEVGSTKI